jgi:hypothetical protein
MGDAMSAGSTEETETAAPEVRTASEFSDGGHEVDITSSGHLMALVFGLALVFLITGFLVWEFYNLEAQRHAREAAAMDSQRLIEVVQHGEEMKTTYGVVDAAADRYRVPTDRAVELVLSQPVRLGAGPAPAGWIHPDDTK